jgi:aquaporin Z
MAESTVSSHETDPEVEEAAAPALVQPTLVQKLTAEVIGIFVLVFFGCGSIVYANATNASSTVTTVGLTFGLAVLTMVYAFGRVSGGHFNPAVSVGAAVGGRLPWSQVGLYVLAQLVGAVGGALALFILMHGFDGFDAHNNMGQNFYGDQGSGYAWWAAFLLELLLTTVFVTVILAVTDERNEHPALAPLAIGLTLAAIHFVAIPATGTSVNPARSIGPALFAGGDSIVQLWLFIIAPTLGGALAGVLYPLLFGRASEPVPGSGITFARPRTAAQVPGYAAPDQYQQQWNQESSAYPADYSRGYGGGYAGTHTGGYAGTAAGQDAYAGTGQQAAAPIIQDGWQWDPVGQQWHPVGQTPEQWRAQQAAQQHMEQERAAREAAQREAAQRTAQQGYAQPGPEQQGQPGDQQGAHPWPEDGDGGTQIRPRGQ